MSDESPAPNEKRESVPADPPKWPPEQEWPTALVEFARLMAKKLRVKAAAREGWAGESFEHLVGRLYDELAELHVAMARGASQATVAREAADVANFCMMIAREYRPGWPKEE